MTAVLLSWDPVWPEEWQPDYAAAVAGAADSGVFRIVWDVSAFPGIEPGSDTWFVLPGELAGVAGHGVVVSYPYRLTDPSRLWDAEPDPEQDADAITVADIDIDLLLPLGDQVPFSQLGVDGPGPVPDSSGITLLDRRAEAELRAAWSRQSGARRGTQTSPLPGTLPQHALKWSLASRYEHDPDAVRVCLVHHGPACSACGFDFEAAFGDAGTGMMQVHHIVPPHLVQDDYELDPVTDLVPLCPNCHAVAHAGMPDPYSPAELRRLLSARAASQPAPLLHGSLVSAADLQAQADAQRLLGPRNPGTAGPD